MTKASLIGLLPGLCSSTERGLKEQNKKWFSITEPNATRETKEAERIKSLAEPAENGDDNLSQITQMVL